MNMAWAIFMHLILNNQLCRLSVWLCMCSIMHRNGADRMVMCRCEGLCIVYRVWLHRCIYGCCGFDYVRYLKLTGAPERPCNPNSPICPGTPFKTNNNNDKNRKDNEV